MQVSVIIPTYNRAYIIEKAIASVLSQSYNNYIKEIIIVDDYSTDNTEEIVRNIDSSLVLYTKNKFKKGANGARNTGIEMSTGKYIAFQDSDDIWLVKKLEKQLNILKENRNIDFCFCSFDSGTDFGIVPKRKISTNRIEELLYFKNFISTQTMIMKSEVAKEIKFCEDVKKLQDWDFVLRVIKKYSIYHVNEVLVKAEQQVDSISKTQNSIEAMEFLIQKHPDFKTKNIYSKKNYYMTYFKFECTNKNFVKSLRILPFAMYYFILVKLKNIKIY